MNRIRLTEPDLLKCCGSTKWAHEMTIHSFPNLRELVATGDSVWWGLTPDDWREALRAHTRNGDRAAGQAVQDELNRAIEEYEQKFGFVFVINSAGKTPSQLLASVKERLRNEPEQELRVAAEQQRELTHVRLARLVPR